MPLTNHLQGILGTLPDKPCVLPEILSRVARTLAIRKVLVNPATHDLQILMKGSGGSVEITIIRPGTGDGRTGMEK